MLKILLNSKPIDFKKVLLIFVILTLLATNIVSLIKYSTLQKELQETKKLVRSQQINTKILDFIDLFITKVLKAETEVDFETRLKLETAVRNLNDKEILNQWQKFTESKTEAEAQKEVKNLLEMLIRKIKL